jgi:hypothetical protein
MIPIKIASLAVLLLLPGYLLIRVSRGGVPPSPHPTRRAWLQGVVASMVISSWLGLVLLECGCFSLRNLLLPLAACSLLLYLIFRPALRSARLDEDPRERGSAQHDPFPWPLAIVLCAFGLACLWFGSSEYIFGGWDSGEYVNMGALIADRGSIVYRDGFFSSIPEAARQIFTDGGRRYMGFNLLSSREAIVSPKFMHLYPLWLALAMKLSGLRAALSLNVLFSLLSLSLCYQIAGQLHGRRGATAAAVFLAVNTVQIWFARNQCAEPLAQLFFLGCVYFWILWRRGGRLHAALSAACAGMMFLTKFETTIILPAMAAALLLSEKRRGEIAFLIVLLAALLHLTVHLCWWDRPYAWAILNNIPARLREHGLSLIIASCIFLVISYLLLWRSRSRGSPLNRINSPTRFLAGSAVLAFITFLYFIRPLVSASPESANLPEFSRVMGEGLFWWSIAAFLWIWLRGLRSEESLLWISALTVTFLFSISAVGEHHLYPWSARRFLPVTLPALAIFSGCFTAELSALLPRLGRSLLILGLALLLIIPLTRAPFLLTARDYPGARAFIRALAPATEAFDILICEQVRLAVPLDFLLRRNVLLFKETEQTIKKCDRVEALIASWLAEGKRVAYVTAGPAIHGKTVAFQKHAELPFISSIVPLTRHAMPRGTVGISSDVRILEAIPLAAEPPPEKDLFIDIGYQCFGLEDGFYGSRLIGKECGAGRWTAPRASLIIPWFEDGSAGALTLSLSTGPRGGMPVPVELLIEGKKIAAFNARGGLNDYTVSLPGGICAGRRRVRLELITPPWDPVEDGLSGYPSALGIFLDSIRITKLRTADPGHERNPGGGTDTHEH